LSYAVSITANCTGNPASTITQSFSDDETKNFQSYVHGTVCTVQEATPGITNACGLMIPKWTTSYVLPTTVANFPNGGTVIVRNKLDYICPHGKNKSDGKCVALPHCNLSETPVQGTPFCFNAFGGGSVGRPPKDEVPRQVP
jgi:hypothetical protein